MTKNIIIIGLFVVLLASLYWQFSSQQRNGARDKPQVHVFLPDGYCGEFVVFWGDNTAPVDEPPEFLSYNVFPSHPNAVVINLPEPYDRADLRFIYQQDAGSGGRNPVFKLDLLGGVSTASGREVLDDGSTRTWTLPDVSIDFNLFTVGMSTECEAANVVERDQIDDLYFELTGTEFRWVSP